MKNFLKNLADRKGIILPMALTYILIFTAEIAGLSEYAAHTQRLVMSEQNQLKSFYLAEAASEKALAAVRLNIASTGVPPSGATLSTIAAPANLYGSTGVLYTPAPTFQYVGGTTTKVLTDGDYAGLNGSVQTIQMDITATDNKNGITHNSVVQQNLEVQLIPIFQFGVFYQNDLEILPGATMNFTGPVHTNGNMYVGSDSAGATLSFQSTITSAGSIYHTRKDGSSLGTGTVRIEDSGGAYQNMYQGSSWLDSTSGNWTTEAINRWGGTVKSAVHGVKTLTFPLPSVSQPHALIERRVSGESAQLQQQKLDYKAHLRIIDGSIMDQGGGPVELRYCSGGGTFSGGGCPGGQTVVNPVASTQFYNFREARTIKSTDINVGLLNGSPAFQALAAANNGVILYVSDRRSQGSPTYQDSVRLVNGSALPVKGLTVAAENPLYVKGDFNTVSKQPSGIVADAFNVLSNSWNDANSTNTNLTNKTATATTVNTALITGNTETVGSQYNGGFENLLRFHEKWSGVSLTYSGSVAMLYNSTIATGNWIYGGNYYTAPIRNWGYDTSFSDPSYKVPGFPSVYSVVKTGFEAD